MPEPSRPNPAARLILVRPFYAARLARARPVVAIAVLVAVLCLAAAPPAFAQSNIDVATKWGLLGTWKVDCAKPTSRTNTESVYVVRDGVIYHDRNYGDGRDTSPVQLATLKPAGVLELTVQFIALKQTRQYLFTKAADGRKRAMSNRNVNTDEYTVRDGKFTANGNPTPWQTRCR